MDRGFRENRFEQYIEYIFRKLYVGTTKDYYIQTNNFIEVGLKML